MKFLLFMSIAGLGLHMDLYGFVGWLGLSISLNGGVCRKPALQPAAQPVADTRRPALPRPFPGPGRPFCGRVDFTAG